MAVTIDRTNYNALVDDDGTNTKGTPWSKNQVKIVLMDPIDGALAKVMPTTGGAMTGPFTAGLQVSANPPFLDLINPSQPVGSQALRIINNGTTSSIFAMNETNGQAGGGVANLTLNRAGGVTVGGALNVGGTVTITGGGPHLIQAAAGGDITFQMRNTLAGATARSTLLVGNDTIPYLLALVANSSTVGTSIWPGSLPSGGELHAFGSGGLSFSCDTPAPMRFFTNNLQRMQVTAAGEVLVSQINDVGGGMISIGLDGTSHTGICIQDLNPANNATLVFFLNSAAGGAGFIGHTGATTVAYNTSSDQRLKIDGGRATNLEALRAVVVHDFRWKADDRWDRGVFAQEAVSVFPRAISEGTDERTASGDLVRPWMADYSKFVPDLIAGWQQHDTAIAQLRAALLALKG